MKEIYDINFKRMNNGAHFTFVSDILARAEADSDRDALNAGYKNAVEGFLSMPYCRHGTGCKDSFPAHQGLQD